MGRKERARERREERRQQISCLRLIPYSDDQRWWCSATTAVVTGANKGVGYEIARQLALHGFKVILTSRDINNCLQPQKSLLEQGLNAAIHQLDILSLESVGQFSQWIHHNFGGIDILINNAGVNFNLGSDNSIEFAETVVETNYFGTKRMIRTMLPLMKPSISGARIVNVSSRLGRLNGRRNRLADTTLRQQLNDEDALSEELIDSVVTKFLEEVKEGNWNSGAWPQVFTDYSVSKLAVNAFTRVMARELGNRPEGSKVYVNCYCPGWVKTGMTGWAGNISAEEAADTGVWLALLPVSGQVMGKFFAERREISF